MRKYFSRRNKRKGERGDYGCRKFSFSHFRENSMKIMSALTKNCLQIYVNFGKICENELFLLFIIKKAKLVSNM
jgi:hypothetical protein